MKNPLRMLLFGIVYMLFLLFWIVVLIIQVIIFIFGFINRIIVRKIRDYFRDITLQIKDPVRYKSIQFTLKLADNIMAIKGTTAIALYYKTKLLYHLKHHCTDLLLKEISVIDWIIKQFTISNFEDSNTETAMLYYYITLRCEECFIPKFIIDAFVRKINEKLNFDWVEHSIDLLTQLPFAASVVDDKSTCIKEYFEKVSLTATQFAIVQDYDKHLFNKETIQDETN